MDLRVRTLKVILSVSLAVSVTTLFTFRVYAIADSAVSAAKGAPASAMVALANTGMGEAGGVQDGTGTLTIKSGSVLINGNPAQTGATIMNGSVVSTSDSSSAILDLGPAGRIQIGPHTSFTISYTSGSLEIRTSCGGDVHVESHNGSLDVKTPKAETLPPGKRVTYNDPVDFTAGPGVNVDVQCGPQNPKAGGGMGGPGLLGVLGLVGVGAAVATGIVVGGGGSSSSRPPVSGS